MKVPEHTRSRADRLEHVPMRLGEALAALRRRPRILLAEDDDDVRWALTGLLLAQGYDVKAVCDGAQLLNELETVMLGQHGLMAPDIIVTDVRMPGFNSINALAGLREAGWTTPMLVISAFGDSSLLQRVRGLGDAEFFGKPLNMPAFEAAITAAARAKPRRPAQHHQP